MDNMNSIDETLEAVCQALDELGTLVLSKNNNANNLVEIHGWHHPAITIEELANIPIELSKTIRAKCNGIVPGELKDKLEDVPNKLKLLEQHTVAQFFGGNSHQAIPAYMTTIQWIEGLIQPLWIWQAMNDPKAMPPLMAKNLATLRKQLDEISIDKEDLVSKISAINDAHEAAELLPANLITLKDSNRKITELSEQSIKDSSKIDELKKESVKNEQNIKDKIDEADKLIKKCEEAYNVTTTKGLAGAFEERAHSLAWSMWVWVAGLLIALGIGSYIGSNRLEQLEKVITGDSHIGIVVLQTFLSILSVGAPLWFAWISTKQISQRFKLAEDYAFKSSVAKAYEGYRKEASRIDPMFEARLFSNALFRLEEPPLRLVDDENHGSPWHELFKSNEFQSALKNIPELKDKFLEIAKDGTESIKNLTSSKKLTGKENKEVIQEEEK